MHLGDKVMENEPICKNGKCHNKFSCYKYVVVARSPWQPYSHFVFARDNCFIKDIGNWKI
jgi:hypothetical protein